MDDIVVTGYDTTYIARLKFALATEFHICNLGSLKYFIGLEVHSHSTGLFVNQAKYLTDLLDKYGMMGAKSCATPMSTSVNLSTSTPPFHDHSLYRQLVGSLQYLTFTRPDITYAVNGVNQFMQHPTILHFTAVKRILRYLCGTCNLGIIFKQGPISLSA